MELHLCLPLVSGCLRQYDGIVVACVGKLWIGNLCPSRCIPELHGRGDTFPHIILAIGIEALKLLLTLLAGKDETPGDTSSLILIDKYHLRGCQCLDAETGILIL